MPSCFFVTDLHGNVKKYRALFRLIEEERPEGVFIGGDLLPSGIGILASMDFGRKDFVVSFLAAELSRMRERLEAAYPRVFAILGNDDGRFEEAAMLMGDSDGLWQYVHNRMADLAGFRVYGYSFVPPTPFQLKDWEKYDVSRYVDPGCVSPEEGRRTVDVPEDEIRRSTIARDLDALVGNDPMDRAIFLFHTPPYRTNLDRAALDGKRVDHVPMDVNVGSIAVKRFIEEHQPLVTLHGHVHESTRITGSWRDRIGRTHCFSAAHGGPELALVRFDPEHPEDAGRELIET